MKTFNKNLEDIITKKNHEDITCKRMKLFQKKPLSGLNPNKKNSKQQITNEFLNYEINVTFNDGIPCVHISNSNYMRQIPCFQISEKVSTVYIQEGVLKGTYKLERLQQKGFKITHVDSKTLKPVFNSLQQNSIDAILRS